MSGAEQSKEAKRKLSYQSQRSPTNTSEGFNTTIFAYGQTGSGKTYSMVGDEEGKAKGVPAPWKNAFEACRQNDIMSYKNHNFTVLDGTNPCRKLEPWRNPRD